MSKEKEEIPLPTDRPGIYKVGKGTIINRDIESLNAYKARKRKMNEIGELKNDVTELKSDINEIKQLLKGLLK